MCQFSLLLPHPFSTPGKKDSSPVPSSKTKSCPKTGDYNEAAWWSTIELHVGIICACLPSLRSLFINLGVRILGSSYDKSKATGYATNASGHGLSRTGNGAEKQTPAQSVPKHGDESDFIPLVEVNDKSAKVFQRAVGDAESYDSDIHDGKVGYEAKAYR